MSRQIPASLAALFSLAGAVGAQSSSVPPVASVATPAVALTADTPTQTAFGTAFTAPKGWTLTSGGRAATVTAPEGDTRISVVDVGPAADAAAATVRAWSLARPDFRRKVKLVTPVPAREGWDERQSISYDTSTTPSCRTARPAAHGHRRTT